MGDVDNLTQRLAAAFQTADQRIKEMQTQADKTYEEMQARYEKFVKLVEKLREGTIKPRLLALISKFENVERIPVQGRHGGELTLSFKKTPNCLASVNVKFSMTHDEEIQNLVLGYDLEILPIFTRYEPHVQLAIPLDQVDEKQVGTWFDDRIVSFVETYLSLQFVDQYQRENMVIDPVTNERFPKSFAKATTEYEGKTYYFMSELAHQSFKKDPASFLKS